jgi:hypothetical protein
MRRWRQWLVLRPLPMRHQVPARMTRARDSAASVTAAAVGAADAVGAAVAVADATSTAIVPQAGRPRAALKAARTATRLRVTSTATVR